MMEYFKSLYVIGSLGNTGLWKNFYTFRKYRNVSQLLVFLFFLTVFYIKLNLPKLRRTLDFYEKADNNGQEEAFSYLK